LKDLYFFIRLFQAHWLWAVTGLLLALIVALSGLSLLTLSGWFITASALAGFMAPDGVAVSFNFMQPAAIIRALAILRTAGRYAERISTHELTFRVLADIRVWFFRQLIAQSQAQLAALRSGDMLSRMTADIDTLDALYLRLIAPAAVALFTLASTSILLFYFSAALSMAVLLIMLLSSIIAPWFFFRQSLQPAEKTLLVTAELRIKLIDMLQGLAELISYRALMQFQQQALVLSTEIIYRQKQSERLAALSLAVSSVLAQLAVLAVSVWGTVMVQTGKLSGTDLAIMFFLVLAAFELLAPLPQALLLLGKTRKAAQRIRALAERPAGTATACKRPKLAASNALQLEKVCFRYNNQSRWLLESITLTIPEGSKIAVIGPSGSGKTTLLQLLLRYEDAQAGYLSLAGRPYTSIPPEQLMTRFAVLSQRSHLFAASIRDNLMLGNPDASATDLWLAVKTAGLENYCRQLPEVLETWVGEDGVRVSGGEARRIALARVFLKNAPILLLDEPTEGLDSETEQEVIAALKVFAKDKTILLVTHRLTGLNLVDEVYSLEDGRLVLH